MLLALLVFAIVTGGIIAAWYGSNALVTWLERRRLTRRIQELSAAGPAEEPAQAALVRRADAGALPSVEQLIARTRAGSTLSRVIAQAGVRTSPSAVVMLSLGTGLLAVLLTLAFTGSPLAAAALGLAGAAAPFAWLAHRRSRRVARFEEQFPEALDLLARAIRAGHAFQTAMGMVAEELPAPVGIEFKQAFEQQNFGLPIKEALVELSARVPSLDVRFFVTAVAIQRETGGNLAEILDNLARVMRERFKIRRQVRVHTAHGRFTGYVLLALPAALALALTYISPDHMTLLFEERIGQLMLMGAMVMQAVGFLWIRRVIRIEV